MLKKNLHRIIYNFENKKKLLLRDDKWTKKEEKSKEEKKKQYIKIINYKLNLSICQTQKQVFDKDVNPWETQQASYVLSLDVPKSKRARPTGTARGWM